MWDNIVGMFDNRPLYVAAFAIVLILGVIAGAASLTEPRVPIESERVGNSAFLSWDPPEHEVRMYEIQGRIFDEDWLTSMFSVSPFIQVEIPPGIISFRVRPWTRFGPGRWSEPSGYFLFEDPIEFVPELPFEDTRMF